MRGASRGRSQTSRILHELVHFAVGEKVIRTFAVYLGVLVLVHLAGKRSLAQLNSFDLVVLLLLSNVVQNAIIGPDNSLLGGLFGAALLVLGNYLLVRFAFFHPRFGRALQGRSTTLVEDGKVLDENLRRELISSAQLNAALKHMDVDEGIDDVEQVVLEPEGTLNPTRKPAPGIGDVLAALERIEQKLG
jgi:uncharacterized membrane protein YcaP (DUF421 family)